MADLNGDPAACSVCGRSMLAGERTRPYVSRDHEVHEVCDLCIVRAESAGWIRADLAATWVPEQPHEGRGRVWRLLERAREGSGMRTRGGGGEQGAGQGEPAAEAGRQVAEPTPEPRRRAGRAPRRSQSDSRRGEEAEEAQQPRPRRRSVPQKPERRIRRAFETFNASPYRRTVSGLIRSLGEPRVSAVTSAESPAEVRITVAWELSWYQWEIDLAGAGAPVRELGKGSEISELAKPDRTWNAGATGDGELRLRPKGEAADG